MSKKIWFTSDTHFTSERTLTLSRRPFKNVTEMDDALIANWNSVVDTDDTVYHLGDFGNYDIIKKLNGQIILLMGNYEFEDAGKDSRRDILQWIARMADKFSAFILPPGDYNITIPMKSTTDESSSLVLNMMHILPPIEERKLDESNFNLFGHYHKLAMIKRNALNVGIDCHNFFPISLDTVLFYRDYCVNHPDEDIFRE